MQHSIRFPAGPTAAALIALCAAAHADQDLATYQELATERHPSLVAARAERDAAGAEVRAAAGLPPTRITYAHMLESVETRVGPQEDRLGVTQSFPAWGERRARVDAARARHGAAAARVQAMALGVRRDVASVYADLYELGRSIALTEENIALVTRLEGVARSRQKTGGTLTAVLKAQLELGRLDDRLRALRARHAPLRARMNALLDREAAAPVPLPVALPEPRALPDTEALASALARRNPALAAHGHDAAAAAARADGRRAANRPRVMLGVETVRTGPALNPDTPDSGKDPVAAMVALDVPLWLRSNAAAVRGARHARDAAHARRTAAARTLRAELESACFRYDDALRRIDLYTQTLVPQAEQVLHVTEESYRTAETDFLDLIDADRLLLDLQLALARARADAVRAYAELEALSGGALDTASHTEDDNDE